ncbi:MAG: hypothetical protein EXR98_17485 [Gemmataceae bacterium]|nr:hypothetical protein [Gemmataceae bacterium]
MNLIEEIIEATLDSNGQLQLTHLPQLPPGPVVVTIRAAVTAGPKRGLADVIREIRADQIARGFHGLSTEQLRERDAEVEAENDEYDKKMERLGALPPPDSVPK